MTLTYWIVTLTSRQTAPLPAAEAARAPSVEQAATIFGGQLQRQANQDVHLFGILALSHGAAAIVQLRRRAGARGVARRAAHARREDFGSARPLDHHRPERREIGGVPAPEPARPDDLRTLTGFVQGV